SAPFHCALMTPAREPLRHALASTKLTAPRFEVFANVDAQARSEPDAVVQALVDQVDQPVQWVATVRAMQAMGVTHALEVGPGRVLAGLVKRIVGRDLPVLSVNRLETIDEVPAFLEGEKARV
ncbi:MAG: malonyl CoA-acyl carrier protein transacylase, partial [Myxococcota bacterium]